MQHAVPRLVLVCLLAAAGPAAASGPLRPEEVPPALRDWVSWVLRGHEAERCSALQGETADAARRCIWPARLDLDLGAEGGRFEQEVAVEVEGLVPLPGDSRYWPEEVEVDGRPAPVVAARGRPAISLAPGTHRLRGRFHWPAAPAVLPVPPETGLLALRLGGEAVRLPNRDSEGRLWLRESAGAAGAQAAALEVEVVRRVRDEIPLQLTTRIDLRVAGESREERIGPVLPAGFVPLRLESPVPARLEPDGRLRVQVRAGRFALVIEARHEGPVSELALPARGEPGAPFDASEVWVFDARPDLRLVELEGAPAVDPSQAELPDPWRALPAYRMDEGATLRLVEKRRGSEGGARDHIELGRVIHLDFDGGGATFGDTLTGEMREGMRLDMGAGSVLGRAAVAGVDQPITRLEGSDAAGIEVPLGPLSVEADSRAEGGASRLPAVGWAHDVAALSAVLELPPGWQLLHASGVDRADSTWLTRWTLLDLFVVLVVSFAFLRLFGAAVGGLALAALALTYTEPGAPRLVWLAVVAAEALRRVVPAGRLSAAVRLLRAAALAALVLAALPFAVEQVRVGLHPALGRPGGGVVPLMEGGFAQAPEREAPPAAPVPEAMTPGLALDRAAKQATLESVISEAKRRGYAPDPNARVPTGPGRPGWSWEQVQLTWSGPVRSNEVLRLWLAPPWLTGSLALLRTALLAALALVALGSARDLVRRWLPGGAAAACALLVLLGPGGARADLPTPELLQELRARLLAPEECAPACASLPRLALEITPERLDARMGVEAAAATAVPLPGSPGSFEPESVMLDGEPAPALARSADGRLWLRVPRGTHEVQLRGALPPRESIEIALPLRPLRVEARVVGFSLRGLRADGGVEGALQLVRERGGAGGAGALEPTPIPPFVSVERRLELGLTWQATTRVRRVAPSEGSIVVEVPLLAGESVTTPDVQVRDGRALVSLRSGEGQAGWSSVLAQEPRLELAAPASLPWTEIWWVDPSPLWHVTFAGIPSVGAAEGARGRMWRPWPGEKLELAVARPAGVAGATLTLDEVRLSLNAGLRAADAALALRMRSSQGGQHAVTLPEGSEPLSLAVNGQVQPLRDEGRVVTFPLVPGAQEVRIEWRMAQPIGLVTRMPAVDLGLASVNANFELALPDSRWILALGGPRLGPAVLFWPVLAVVAALALLLGRVRSTPLRAHHWFLLGVGLTQAPLPAAASVVAWLLALGWRGERGAELRNDVFDLLQIVLAVLTLVALGSLFLSIEEGLLGRPEMQIAGNGSSAALLRWYQDRSAAALPQPWALSLSLWLYRLLMLAWALWVAQALVGWLRWGWRCFSAGDLWRSPRRRRAGAEVTR